MVAINPDTGNIAKIMFGNDKKVRLANSPIDLPSPSNRSSILIDLLLQYMKVNTKEKKQK